MFFSLITGYPDPGNPDLLLNATEALLRSISKDKTGCFLDTNMTSFTSGPSFSFDTTTLTKIYKSLDPGDDLCHSGKLSSYLPFK